MGKAPPKKLANAPRGVPVISNWKQDRNGGIDGRIFGSPSFNEGEFVSTSPITSDAVGGTVVTTESGSKYFLEDASSAADAKKREAAEKKEAAAAAAAKKIEAEERKAAQAEARELAAAEKRAAAEANKNKASAKQAVGQAKRGASISLFGLGKSPVKVAPQKVENKAKSGGTIRSKSSKSAPKMASKAPRGVPAISNWKQNRDGSISGRVFGSNLFDEGESVTTSAITSDAIDGSVVQTLSGSKYYLQPKEAAKSKGGIGLKNFMPSGTISISSGFSEFTSGSPKSNKKAPKGVPSLSGWKKNRDDSVSGLISGSPNFNEGERITTSPIESGKLEDGQVVTTGSGSKYFLN